MVFFKSLVSRVEIKNLGGGRHQLIFNRAEMEDSGEIMCASGRLTSSCKLSVSKGEDKPKINLEGDIEGPVSKPLVFNVPYAGNCVLFTKYHFLRYCLVIVSK